MTENLSAALVGQETALLLLRLHALPGIHSQPTTQVTANPTQRPAVLDSCSHHDQLQCAPLSLGSKSDCTATTM